jgi:ribosome-associated toxin RatA of RatAB toxin-antitoxin module
VQSQNKREITTSIVRRLNIDGIYHMKEANLNEFMTISEKGTKVTVEIDYEARDVLVGNVFIVTHFGKVVTN